MSQELVKVDPQEWVPAVVDRLSSQLTLAGLHKSPIGVLATYDLSSQEGRERAVSLLNRKAKPLAELTSGIFHVVSITCEPCQWEDEESGELVQTMRTLIELSTGELMQLHAVSGLQCLCRILWAYPPPWSRPIVIHYEQGKSGKKRTIYHLTLKPGEIFVDPPDPPSNNRKNK